MDHAGDDTYWAMTAANQGGAWDIGIGMLLDHKGNDAYRADGLCQGGAAMQGIAWLIDLAGTDRYVANKGATQGQSSGNRYHYNRTKCLSWSMLIDAGGNTDIYSTGRPNGQALKTGTANTKDPANSKLHGLFIDTTESLQLWP